jgi:hypothetical protein
MRISQRASRTTAAGLVLALGALTATACSSSSSSGGSAPAGQGQTRTSGDAGANANDIQILNSLQLTSSELDTAFATDNKWQSWADADMSKLLIKQAQACTNGMIDTSAKSLPPVNTAFKADQLPSDAPGSSGSSSPSSPSSTKSSSGKKSGAPSSSSSSSGSASGAPADGNPTHWVVSTAIAYKSAGAAKSAVGGMGTISPTASDCGGPATNDATVGGGIGEVGPTWDNSLGVFVFVDTKSNASVAVVAQRRGRYVVLTYTRGTAVKLPTGYYDLEAGPDTSRAADAATTALAQLTDAVVNR